MVDHISPPLFPERLVPPLRQVLRGEPATWPPIGQDEVAAIEAHGMTPLIQRWSGESSLRDIAVREAAFEALRLRGLQGVLTALSDARIAVLILKGTALAYSLYELPELRPRSDTDLLAREEDRARLQETLSSLGYQEHVAPGDRLGLRQTVYYREDDFGFLHSLDVHWSVLNPASFSGLVSHEEALSDAVPLGRIHPAASGLDRVRALLLACVHRVAHHHDSPRLIWLIDIHLLANELTAPEWERLWTIARSKGMIGVVGASLTAAADLSRLSYTVVPPVARDEPSALYLRRDVSRARLLVHDLHALPGWRARFTRLFDLAFPARSYMEKEFGATSTALLPLAYLRRATRGVARLFRSVA